MRFKRSIFVIISILLVFVLSSCTIIIDNPAPEGILTVHVIDVGQGDSILITLPNKQTALIDGGSRKMGDRVVKYIQDQKISKIDYIIATHPHEDHIGGLIKVIETFEIGNIYMPDKEHTSKTFEDLLTAIEDKGYKMKRAKAGVVMVQEDALKAYFLAPVKDNYRSLNDFSAVLKVEFGDVGMLFTGDAEVQSEKDMIDSRANLMAQILKVSHHGSRTSSSKEFLDAVKPQYALISLGKDNTYGHPHQETIKVLEDLGIVILRTDIDGNIIITTDGKEIKVD
jgi:competence protein ComEC